MLSRRPLIVFASAVLLSAVTQSQSNAAFLAEYKGQPFHDTKYNGGPENPRNRDVRLLRPRRRGCGVPRF